MAVRLKDVANELGLSISTVSAVLQNRPDFNEATRRRVLAKVKELNYRPNRLARSLAMQKSHVIGVVVPNLSRSFFPAVLEGIEVVVQNAGYHLVISNTGDLPSREDEEIATLLDRQVDGLIIATASLPEKATSRKVLKGSDIPYIFLDRFFPGVPFVGCDDEVIGFMAANHLLEQGYREVAHLSRKIVATGVGRYRGYVRAMHARGLRVRQNFVMEAFGEPGGYEGMRRLLDCHPRPDAIFAVSDPVAIGAMRALHECGIQVPAECGVIGVGRVRYGEDLRVGLSTIDTHSHEMGKSAAAALLRMIEGKPAPSKPIFLTPTLIVRASTQRRKSQNPEKTHHAPGSDDC